MTSLSELIRHDKPLITDAVALYPYSKAMEKDYRFTTRFDDEVLMHRVSVDKKYIALPRALCPLGIQDMRVDGKVVDFPKCPSPKPNQVEIFNETEAFLKAGQSGLVSAYTGWGKTVLGYKAAHVVRRKTLVITTKEDIYGQWFDGAKQFLGLPDHKVGQIRGDKCEVQGTDFVVAMIHSLVKEGKYPDWIGDEFGLVIFDECHRVPADTFEEAAYMFPAKQRLGLSATLERSDGKEILIHAHIGPVRARTEGELHKPKVLRFKTDWKCPMVIRHKPNGEKKIVKLPHEPGKTVHVEKIMMKDHVRNHLICKNIYDAYKKGRKVVVFSTLIEHLDILHRTMVEMGVPGKQMGRYGSATTKAEIAAREKVVVNPIIWTTYTMMAEGTNIPWLDTCVLAMPRSQVTQPVGRIRREYPDKAFPVVMDFVDEDSPAFFGYSRKRMQWYKSIGCAIVEMDT